MRSQTLRSGKVGKRKTMRKRNAGTTLLNQGMVEVAVTRGLTGPLGSTLCRSGRNTAHHRRVWDAS